LFLFFLLLAVANVNAQTPTVLGTQLVNGGYTTYDLTDVGSYRRVVLVATSTAATGLRNWEFAEGTAGAPTYTNNWRPFTSGNTITINQRMNPASALASARYNTAFGGASGLLPAITNTRTYTVNVSENSAANNEMAVLETTFSPVSIASVTNTPTVPTYMGQASSLITVTTGAAINAGELLYVRWTIDNWTTSNISPLATVASATSRTGAITVTTTSNGYSATPTTHNLQYYVLSSTAAAGAADNQLNHTTADVLTLRFRNSTGELVSGSNFSYTVQNTYASANSTGWNVGTTWVGGATPPSGANVLILSPHNVTIGGATTVNRLTINNGGTYTGTGQTLTVANGGTIANAGTITQTTGVITFGTTGTFSNTNVYVTTTGGMNFGTGGSVSHTGTTFTAGTGTVAFLGLGTITGTLTLNNTSLAGAVAFSTSTTVNGTLTINGGGSVTTNSPIYGAASTLLYNVNGAYGRFLEWNATGVGTINSTPGYPNNVTIGAATNYTALDLPNGSTGIERACAGILTIYANAALGNGSLTMGAMTVPLTVGGNVFIFTAGAAGTVPALTLGAFGGDLNVGGNWTNFSTSNRFVPNGRTVAFIGSANQTITRTGGETFAFLTIRKSVTNQVVTLASAVTLTGTLGDVLTFDDGGAGRVGILNLNAQTFTMAGDGGNIFVTGATHQVYNSSVTAANFDITGNKSMVDDGGGARTFTWGSNASVSNTTINVRVTQGKTLTVGNGTDITWRTSNSAAGISTVAIQTVGGTAPTGQVTLTSLANISVGGNSGFGISAAFPGRLNIDGLYLHAGGASNFNQGSGLSATNPGVYVSGTGIVRYSSTAGAMTGTATQLQFQSGSQFQLRMGGGGTIPTASWNVASNVYIQNTAATPVAGGFNLQTFGNLILDHSVSGLNLMGTTHTFTVAGTFTIENTGSTNFNSANTAVTMTVTGQFLHTSGTFTANTSTNTTTINMNGGYNMFVPDGSTASFVTGTAGTSTINIRSTFSQSQNGTTGTGTFAKTAGTFNFNFTGTTSQTVNAPGTGMTNTALGAINGIIVNNTGVSPNNVITVNRDLQTAAITLTSGVLNMDVNTLTYTGNQASMVTLGGTGTAARFIGCNSSAGGFLWSPGVSITAATFIFPIGYITAGPTNCYRPATLVVSAIPGASVSNTIQVGYSPTGTIGTDADNVPTTGNTRSRNILKILATNAGTITATLNVTNIVSSTANEFNNVPVVGAPGTRMYAWRWNGTDWVTASAQATALSNPLAFTAFGVSLVSGSANSYIFGNPGADLGGVKIWNTGGTGAWLTSTNWFPSGAPTSTDIVIIDLGGTPPTITAASGNDVLNINNAGVLSLSAGSVLNVYGVITNTGTFSANATSEVNYLAAGNQTIGTVNYGNLRISGSGIKTLNSGATAVAVNGTLIVESNFQLPATGTAVTAFTVNNISVQPGGVFDLPATSISTPLTNTMNVSGNIKNDGGTFNMYKANGGTNYAVCNITYNTTSSQTVYGSGITTNFYKVAVTKIAAVNKVIVKANPCTFGNGTPGAIAAVSDALRINSGTYEQWYGTMPILVPTVTFAFPVTGRVIFGSDPSLADSAVSPNVSTITTASGGRYSTSGQIDVNTSGAVTFNIFSGASNTGLFLSSVGITHTWKKGTVNVNGGYLNMRAAAAIGTKQNLNLSGANVNIDPADHTATNPTGFPYFSVNSGGTFNVLNMTAGTVTLLGINPSASATAAEVLFTSAGGGEWNVSGGNFVLGNGSSTSLVGNKGAISVGPSGANVRNFFIDLGGAAFHNLTLNCAGGASTVAGIRIIGTGTGVNGTLTLTSGSYFDLGSSTLTIGKADGTGGDIINTASALFCGTNGSGTTNTITGAPSLVFNGIDDVSFNNTTGMYFNRFTLNRKSGSGQTVLMANGMIVYNNNTFAEYALSTLFANYTGVFTKSRGILSFTAGSLAYGGLTPTLNYASTVATGGEFNNGVDIMDATTQEWPAASGPQIVALGFSHPTLAGTLNLPFARTVFYFYYMSGNRTFNSNLTYANDPRNLLRYFNIAGVNTVMSAEEFPAAGGPCNLVMSVNSTGNSNTGSIVTNGLGARTLSKIGGFGGNYFSRFGIQTLSGGSSLTVEGVLCGSPFSTSIWPDANGAGKIIMSGPTASQISGGYFNNIEIDNVLGTAINGTTSPEAQVINNTNPVRLYVSGTLTLTNGLLSTSLSNHKLSIYNPIAGAGTPAQIAARISSSLQLTVEGSGPRILLPPVGDLGRLEINRVDDGGGFAATLSENLGLLDYNPVAPNGYYQASVGNGTLEQSPFVLLQNFVVPGPGVQTATFIGICAVGTVNNVTINPGAILSVDCNMTINGKLILQGNADAVTAGGAISYGPNGTLRVESTYTGTLDAFKWPTGGNTVKSLEVGGNSSLTLPAAFIRTLTNNAIVETGSTLDVGANTLTINNDFTNTGAYANSAGKIVFAAKTGTSHNISGAGSYSGRIEVNNTTVGASIGTSPITLGGDLLLTGVGSDLYIPGGRSLIYSGASITGGGSFIGSTTSFLTIAGTGNVTLPPIVGGLISFTVNRASGIVSPGSDILVQNVFISNGQLDLTSPFNLIYAVAKALTYNSNANTTGLEWQVGVAGFTSLTVSTGAGNTITLSGNSKRYDISGASVTITSGNLALGGATSGNTLDFHNGSQVNAIQGTNRLTITAGQLQIAGNTLKYNPGAPVGQTKNFNAGILTGITSTSASRLEIGGNGSSYLPTSIITLKKLVLNRIADGFVSGWLNIVSALTIADTLQIQDGNIFNATAGPVNNLIMGTGSRIIIGINGETISGSAFGGFSAPPVASNPALGYSLEYQKTTTTGFELIGTMAKVVVGAGRTVTTDKSTSLTDSLKIMTAGTLTDGVSTNLINVQGHILNMGTVSTTGSNSFTLNGTLAQTLSGRGTVNRISTSNAAGISLAGSGEFGRSTQNITGLLNISTGTFNLNAGILNYTGASITGSPNNLVATSGQAALSFGGSSSGLLFSTGIASLDSVGINNANNVTAASNFSTAQLGLTNGKLVMNSGIITYTGSSSAASTVNSYIALRQGAAFRWNNLPALNAAYQFPVGPETITTYGLNPALSGYRPFTIAYTPTAGSTLSVAFAAHPNPTNLNGTTESPANVSIDNGNILNPVIRNNYQLILTPSVAITGASITMEAQNGDYNDGTLSPPEEGISIFTNLRTTAGYDLVPYLNTVPNMWTRFGRSSNALNGSNTTILKSGLNLPNLQHTLVLGLSNPDDLQYGTTQVYTWNPFGPSTNYGTGLNWSLGSVPDDITHDIVVATGPKQPILSSADQFTVGNASVNLGAALKVDGTLLVNGGSFNTLGTFDGGIGTVRFVSLPAIPTQTIEGSGQTRFNNLRISSLGVNGTQINGTNNVSVLGVLTLTGSSKFDLNNNVFTLRSTATGTGSIAKLTTPANLQNATQVRMQRYVPSFTSGWYFLGTPIQSQTVSNWGDNFDVFLPYSLPGCIQIGPDHTTVFVLKGDTLPTGKEVVEQSGWRIPKGTANVNVGAGYRVFLKSSSFLTNGKTFDNIGVPQTGAFPFTVSYNAVGYNGGGWNFMANPYPSAIDWDAAAGWTRTNMGLSIYTWRGSTGQYGAYVAGSAGIGTNGATNLIPSSQGFMVRVNNGSAVFAATEDVKTSSTGTFLRTNVVQNYMRMKMVDASGQSDEAIIRFNPEATELYDDAFDAFKLNNGGMNFGVIQIDGKRIAIHSQPIPEIQNSIPLFTEAVGNGTYSLQFDLENLDFGTGTIYLKDNYLGTIQELNGNFEYPFVVNSDQASQGSTRFELVFATESVTGISEFADKFDTRVVPNPGNGRQLTLVLKNAQETQTHVVITDVLGKVLVDQDFISNGNRVSLETNLAMGVYQVLIQNGGNTSIQKIVVNR